MKVNIRNLADIISQLFQIEDITLMSNALARWSALQAWLLKNPRWKPKLERWANIPTQYAYDELCKWVSEEGEISPALLRTFIGADTQKQIETCFLQLQSIYEREAQKSAPKLRQ